MTGPNPDDEVLRRPGRPGGLAAAWVEATEDLRGDAVPIPPRSGPRAVELD